MAGNENTTASILALLQNRHSDDVFVAECKDGPTHGGSHRRLDGWAMKRSWVNPCVIGYEIKVSRANFLSDEKWQDYLPMCNQLYFVCPWGLIQPPEVPAEVGLLWASKTGTRLYSKAKAAHREVKIPETVWRYILMCRSKITRENQVGSKREFWESWLVQKKIDDRFGYSVGKALGQRIDEEITKARAENKRLQDLMQNYEGIRDTLKHFDIDPDKPYECSAWQVEHKLEKAKSVIPDGLLYRLESLSKQAISVRDQLKEIEAESL